MVAVVGLLQTVFDLQLLSHQLRLVLVLRLLRVKVNQRVHSLQVLFVVALDLVLQRFSGFRNLVLLLADDCFFEVVNGRVTLFHRLLVDLVRLDEPSVRSLLLVRKRVLHVHPCVLQIL